MGDRAPSNANQKILVGVERGAADVRVADLVPNDSRRNEFETPLVHDLLGFVQQFIDCPHAKSGTGR